MFHSPQIFLQHRPVRNLIAGALKRYARIFRHRYMVERRMGLLLLLDQKNVVDRHLLFRGFWEPDRVECLGKLASKLPSDGRSRMFLDIGSHEGLYALLMQRLGVFDRILAFEPVPANLAQLRANLLLNDCLDGIEVVEKAVSSEIGEAVFVIETDRNRGMSRMADSRDAHGLTQIRVATTTMDAFLPIQNHVLVMKIDVEGAELSVIQGMDATLRQNSVVMQIERNGPVDDLTRLLEPYGITHLHSLGEDHYFVSRDVLTAQA